MLKENLNIHILEHFNLKIFVWVSIVLCAPVAPTRRRSWFVFELMVFGAGLLALP
jgi:hypothetical protein